MIEAVLSNKDHPEYGEAAVTFPIPRGEYNRCIELAEAMGIGDASKQDCQMNEILGAWPVLKRLENTQVSLDELDYLAKRLDSFDVREVTQFQAMAEKLDLHGITQMDDGSVMTEYVSASDQSRYGLLLDENLDVLARLPQLCDVRGDGTLVFDDMRGTLRAARIFTRGELVALAGS